MSVKEIREAMEKGTVHFGVRQAVRHAKKAKAIFIGKDTRDSTVDTLEQAKAEFIVLKTKRDLAKELNLDFESEVITVM